MNEKIDQSPAVLDLILYAGDGADFQVDFVNDTDETIDVSGYIWTAQIRRTRTATEAADLEIFTTDAAIGTLTIHISAEVTRGLTKNGVWDLQCASSDTADPLTILQGTVTCNQDVTRSVVVVP